MSSFTSAAEALAAIDDALALLERLDLGAVADPPAVPDSPAAPDSAAAPELAALVRGLAVRTRRLEAASARVVAAFDRQGAWRADGAVSAAAWLRAHLRLTPAHARSTVRTARRVRDLPALREAWHEGAISEQHVRVVVEAMRATPERVAAAAAAEPTFAAAARELDPRALGLVVARWAHAVDPLGALAAEAASHEARSLSASRTFEGLVAIDGVLPPESGAVVMTALEAWSTSDYRDARSGGSDSRTPGQRRADALVGLCQAYLDSGAAPEVAGVRPHLQVTVALADLVSPPGAAGGAPAELAGVGPLSVEAARRVACDAAVSAIGLDVGGMPVSYGRTVRVVPAGLRRFLVARDGGCVFPGCDRPPGWTQAHHLRHWAHGGTTDADNLALVCQAHHHLLHEGGFAVRGSPRSGLVFTRPDGSVLDVGRSVA